MSKVEMIRGGMYGNVADAVNGSTETGVTAAGTTQTDAAQLTAGGLSVIGTAAAATGVKLPALDVGDNYMVHNLGANAVLVYPGIVGGVINALAANAGFSVGAGKAAIFRKTGAANFIAMLGA